MKARDEYVVELDYLPLVCATVPLSHNSNANMLDGKKP